ncbi:uncharacterized protein BKA55DRAFT_686545 [Fusarium redolens]|uniref:Uncharacterized protein n=1 Tax=Fusarium redolens TaxID=48865 RepID=A0A9P9KFP0_FUSRE|nr:uncharacterized protein BKA55DRAFT_686545 [Fusarium redolens]KAH7260967.1 hypothetical protein BKA55DRAFT_686545 [Fusarium redolens]
MRPVESQYLEGLVKFNSILILDVDCWVQCNKTLPTEIWLDILDLAELYVDENTYKPVYGIEMNPRSTNNGGTGSALVCNILEERKKCGELEGGNRVNAYDKCLQDPSYKLDPENDDIDEDEEYYFRVSKLANNNAISIPISHLAFETKFLFCKVTVQNMISRLERGNCNLCGGYRTCNVGVSWKFQEVIMFSNSLDDHKRHECLSSVECPLCIGDEFTELDLNQYCDDVEDEDKMPVDEFHKVLRKRYKELGYEC